MNECPYCHGELLPDPSSSGHVLCHHCKKRFKKPTKQTNNNIRNSYVRPTQDEDPFADVPVQGEHHDVRRTKNAKSNAKNMNKPSRELPITALVIGIISIPLSIIPALGWLFALCGVIISIMAFNKISKQKSVGNGLAIGGLVTAIVGGILATAIFALNFIGINAEYEEREAELRAQQQTLEQFENKMNNKEYWESMKDLFRDDNTYDSMNDSMRSDGDEEHGYDYNDTDAEFDSDDYYDHELNRESGRETENAEPALRLHT